MQRLYMAIFAFVMMAFLAPLAAQAQASGSIYMGGSETVSSTNIGTDQSGTGWTWTANTATLTLTADYTGGHIWFNTTSDVTLKVDGDVTINAPSNAGVYSNNGSPLTIDVASGKTLTITGSSGASAIGASGSLTITGSGTVNATSDLITIGAYTITVTGSVNITAAATGSNYVIYAADDITIGTTGTVSATGSGGSVQSALRSYSGSISITSGTVNVTNDAGTAIVADGGSVSVTGNASVTATAPAYGIASSGNITISTTGTVSATAVDPIWTYNGGVAISGGTVTAVGTGANANGIVAQNGIAISGGTVNATATDNGYALSISNALHDLTISGGATVTTNAGSGGAGIACGDITITGAGTTFTAQTGTAIVADGDVTVSGAAVVTATSGETAVKLWGYEAQIVTVDGSGSKIQTSGNGTAIDATGASGAVTVSVANSGAIDAGASGTAVSGTATITGDGTGTIKPGPVTLAAIPGVTPPVTGATPVTAITPTAQYTGTVSWSPTVSTTFEPVTAYTATITLTPVAGYILTGVTQDFFTVAGARTVTNAADDGTVTAVFPATAKAALTITAATLAAKTYDGTTAAGVASVTFSGSPTPPVSDTDYTVTAAFDDPNAGTGKTATVTVTLTGAGAAKYTLATTTYNLTGQSITQAATGISAPDQTVYIEQNASGTGTYDLNQIIPVAAHPVGTISYALDVFTPGNSVIASSPALNIDGHTLEYTLGTTTTDGHTSTQDISVSTTNYADITLSLIFKVTAKTPVTISGVSIAGKTYDGQPIAPTGTAIVTGGTATEPLVYAYTGTAADGDSYNAATPPTKAGAYSLTISTDPTDGVIGETTIPFVITKAPLTFTADNASVALGAAPPTYTCTVSGLASGDTEGEVITTAPTAACTYTTTSPVGTYPITLSGAALNASSPDDKGYNYEIAYVSGTLTVASTYALTLTAGAGGSITTGTSGQYAAGALISVTANPNSGYTFSNWTASGITVGNTATVSFTMPANTVSLTANFTATVPTYGVSVGNFSGGSVSTNKTSAQAGETVTLTVAPAAGYELDGLSVYRTGSPGTSVETRLIASLPLPQYQFTMPAYSVTITASFSKTADQRAVENARYLIENAAWNVAQADANTQSAIRTWLAGQINSLLSGTGITVTASGVTVSNLTAATAGDDSNPPGSNGGFTFIVSLYKGNSSTTVYVLGTIVATVYSTGIDTPQAKELTARVIDGSLHLSGLVPGEILRIYNMQGQPVHNGKSTETEQRVYLREHGVYIVTAGSRTVKVMY